MHLGQAGAPAGLSNASRGRAAGSKSRRAAFDAGSVKKNEEFANVALDLGRSRAPYAIGA
jgi:hypothetical protein